MLALLFLALALPVALVAFILGAVAATRYHQAQLPRLLERTAEGVRDRLRREIDEIIDQVNARPPAD